MKRIKLRKAVLALVIAMSIFGSAVAFGGCAQPIPGSGADGDPSEEEAEEDTTEEETTEETSEETEESAEEEISYQVDPDKYESEMIRNYIIENSDNEFLVFDDLSDNTMIDGMQEGLFVQDLSTNNTIEFLKFDSMDTALYQTEILDQDTTENEDGSVVFNFVGFDYSVIITVYPDGMAVREYISNETELEPVDIGETEETTIDEELEQALSQYKNEKIRAYISEHVYDPGVSMLNDTEILIDNYSDVDEVQGIEESLSVTDETNNMLIEFIKFDTFEHALEYITPTTGIEMTEMSDGSIEFTIGPEGTECKEAYGTIDTDGLVIKYFVLPD
ncbi:MAG: hypothetical protein J6U23_15325 [Clostridiales bacterium]|nr:hypothetical protein [Clostridiales bacterium]